MSNTYVIEVDNRTAGIVVADAGGFRFFSALRQFGRLDGQHFRKPSDAEKAARTLITRRTGTTLPRHEGRSIRPGSTTTPCD